MDEPRIEKVQVNEMKPGDANPKLFERLSKIMPNEPIYGFDLLPKLV